MLLHNSTFFIIFVKIEDILLYEVLFYINQTYLRVVRAQTHTHNTNGTLGEKVFFKSLRSLRQTFFVLRKPFFISFSMASTLY